MPFFADSSLLCKSEKPFSPKNVLDEAIKILHFVKFQPRVQPFSVLCNKTVYVWRMFLRFRVGKLLGGQALLAELATLFHGPPEQTS